jgi:hypothetical protein
MSDWFCGGSGLKIVPSDKDGVVMTVHKSTMSFLLASKIESLAACYRRVN